MSHVRLVAVLSVAVASILALCLVLPGAELAAPPRAAQQPDAAAQQAPPSKPEPLLVTVGKSLIINSPLDIQRISYANDTLLDAVAINSKEILVNGKAPGETSLIIWQRNGNRLVFDLTVRPSAAKLDAVRQQIARDFPDSDINVTYDNETVFVRGTVKDVISADRVKDIASSLGKVVNLLRVEVPAEDPQILLKVRFADIDRGASIQLGVNLGSGAFNTVAGLGTTAPPISTDGAQSFSISDAVNIFLFRRDLNLGAAIQALQTKSLAQVLAEPNLLTTNGQQASFLAGGEFPYPQVQPGGAGGITIVFKEYGVRLSFIPTITPRGTIRLKVSPEVSALDFSNALSIQGYPVPGLTTKRFQTEVELESGQSFVIAGLMNNNVTESFSKVPGISSIPVLGNLFKTRTTTKNNSELLVLITPELVRPFPADQSTPMLTFKEPFLTRNSEIPMGQPGVDKTGPVPVHPPTPTMPLEQLIQAQKQGQAAPAPAAQTIMMLPVNTAQPNVNPGVTPTPMSGSGSGGR